MWRNGNHPCTPTIIIKDFSEAEAGYIKLNLADFYSVSPADTLSISKIEHFNFNKMTQAKTTLSEPLASILFDGTTISATEVTQFWLDITGGEIIKASIA